MPRGTNPNSLKALEENREKGQFSGETAVKAAEASLETRTMKKTFRESLREELTPEKRQKISKKLITLAEHGNLKAFELIRDTIGEKPNDKVQYEVDPIIIIDDMTKPSDEIIAGLIEEYTVITGYDNV